ncbi:MAG: desulfoferrodoxin [Treponema sp.]|nr:MAG: desulfoferrodoxin [Treponema sp.]
MKEPKFFLTGHDCTFIGINACGSAEITCKDNKAEYVKANTVDAAKEKHVPVVEVNGQTVTVKVGSVSHPMTDEHNIGWVCLRTEKGLQFKELPVNENPEISFSLTADDKVIEAYGYCNLHGLWVGK